MCDVWWATLTSTATWTRRCDFDQHCDFDQRVGSPSLPLPLSLSPSRSRSLSLSLSLSLSGRCFLEGLPADLRPQERAVRDVFHSCRPDVVPLIEQGSAAPALRRS